MAIGFFDGDKANASPESIKRKRELIARLMSGGRAPRDVGEGLHAIGQGLQAAVLGSRADNAEQAGNAERSRIMAGILGGGAPMAAVGGGPVATGSATGSAAVSGNVGKGPAAFQEIGPRVKSDLMRDFGLSTEQAAGIVGNLAHESGGFGTLQEIKPMIPGSRGGFGYAQWTGPRRRQFESWAAENKLDPASYEANYGFLKHELANTGEGRVLDRIRQTNDPTQATRIFSDVFLRPGIPGMGSREKWTQRALAFSQQPQMASNMPVVSPGPGAAPMPLARQQAETAPMPMAGPQGNEGLAQDGAGELQAGGSGLMAEPAVYRDQLNNVPAADLTQRGPMPALPPGFDVSSLVTPAGQPPGAQGFADNEDQTRIMEAQMAAEQGLPYAGNEPALSNQSDVFSPIPMGFGRNPFAPSAPVDMAQAPAERLPMDRATFDQITSTGAPLNPAFMAEGINPSWGGQNADVAAPGAVEVSGPRQVQAPMPPPRPSDLGPQSPFVPPAMRQPMPVDMGGENGISPMQFIESEFARREGRPDPRMAMGAPVAQAATMPAGAPPMPVGGQSAPMGGAPAAQAQAQAQAQAPAQRPGMHDERWLMSVITSPATAQYAPWALETLNKQRATLQAERQAEAERARTQQANEAAARAAGLDPALLGNPVIAQQAAASRFAKPEPATTDQKDLAQANKERRAANLPELRMDEWKIQKARAGATSITNNVGAKADEKFSEAFAKGDADALGTIATAGMAARRNMARIDRLEGLLSANPTGGLAELQRRAGEFGINTKGLNEIQAAQALINSLVPEQRQPGSGTMSDADLALFKESLPRIINQPGGNKLVIDAMRGIAKYDAEGAAIVQQLREGKLNRTQAFEALQGRVNPLAELSMPRSQPNAPARAGGPRIISVEPVR